MAFQTGDIALFSEHPTNPCMAVLDCLIKCCTRSRYSHTALVIVDPPFAPQCKGVYVWESSWHGTKDPQDNLVKFGVQLTPMSLYTDHYPGSVSIYRRAPTSAHTRHLFSEDALIALHKKVYKHGYDTRPKDWCSALFRRRIQRHTQVFTCSAFVSFALTELRVLGEDTPWTIVSAAELSSGVNARMLQWVHKYGEDRHIEQVANPLESPLI